MNYFRDNYTQLNTLRVMLVIFALIAVVAPIVTLLILQEEKKVLIMDQGGNYHLAVASSFADAKKLHIACAKSAAIALLTRTPAGVLYPDLLKQSFTVDCDDWLRKYFDETKPEFELKKMRQIAEIRKLQILDQGNGRYVAHIKVYLTRACEYQGITFVETAEALLTFTMAENPDIAANGRLPLVTYQILRCDIRKTGEKQQGKNFFCSFSC